MYVFVVIYKNRFSLDMVNLMLLYSVISVLVGANRGDKVQD